MLYCLRRHYLRVLSAKQTCELLGISKATLYRLTNAGLLPKIQISIRRVGWSVDNINDYIEQNTKLNVALDE